MASFGLLLAVGLALRVQGFDLPPCSAKPTFSGFRCADGSAVACWSHDPDKKWLCWEKAWAPSWALGSSAPAADAECMSHDVAEDARFGAYAGACTFEPPSKAALPPPTSRQLDWGEARQKAHATLDRMTLAEKEKLMLGVGWVPGNGWYDLQKGWYVGNTEPIPRLGIPSLNMQDASAGFRPYWGELVGTVTAWPSLLALSATWDPATTRDYAYAVGEEFVGKGANVLLGPGVNTARVARNGRTFEYITGEDPYLGSVLGAEYVRGVQSHNLIAVVKHWVLNDQENHRGEESSNIDAKTAWELYYPPFEAAVKAGVDAAMCSYNRINGAYSCENAEELNILKKGMEFQGFVQSDWWATHHTSVSEGLDQDMPGTPRDHFTQDKLATADPAALNESCVRILSAMYRANLMENTKCSPPHCMDHMLKNVTSSKHFALAQKIATQSVVLLKNEGNVLPLSKSAVTRIAIVGDAANAKAYNPNGSGQDGVDENGKKYDAWNTGDIYSGGGSGHVVGGYTVTAAEGLRSRAQAEGIEVVVSATNDARDGAAAALKADLTIVVVGAWSGEGQDRDSLSLSRSAEEMIEAVGVVSKKTVVLMEIAGSVLMPWRESAEAIAVMFLGGQETGNAWANAIFGDNPPEGRLPITMPATDRDTIVPGGAGDVWYSEGLATGYRNPKFKAAFAFGHGLTYTEFAYSEPYSFACGDDVCVKVQITNVGKVSARTTAQLYVRFPEAAGHPAPFLKGFYKTSVILPDATATAEFKLTERDLSYYDKNAGGFVMAMTATALIGESSADIRHELVLFENAAAPRWVGSVGAVVVGVVGVAFCALVRRGRAGREAHEKFGDSEFPCVE